jgi:hypothetical protein
MREELRNSRKPGAWREKLCKAVVLVTLVRTVGPGQEATLEHIALAFSPFGAGYLTGSAILTNSA